MKFRLEAPPPRPGFTLTEVLMAMFVMALGMISLLALFPAGFINARWALDIEQVSRAAANGQAMTEMPRVAVNYVAPGALPLVGGTATSVRNDNYFRPEAGNTSMCWQYCATTPPAAAAVSARLGRDSFLKSSATGAWTFNTSIYAPKPVNPTTGLPVLLNSKVKYPPVFVDPIIAEQFKNPLVGLPFHVGVNAKDDAGQAFAPFGYILNNNSRLPVLFANTNATFRPPWSIGIPRFSTSQYMLDSNAGNPVGSVLLRMKGETAMSDEVDFGTNGQPNVTNNTTGISSGLYASQTRFSWAYMCQWYDYATPEVCDLTTVVFNSRPNSGGIPTFPSGEDTYTGFPGVALATGIEGPANNYGRLFVKGLTQAAFRLGSAEASKIKAGDWIMDSTFILPEYNVTFPSEVVPFLDEYDPLAVYVFPQPTGGPHLLRPGLVGGHFYKVLDISPVRQDALTGQFYQTLTLDRPARSDGFAATYLSGVADVITKGVGRMPQR